jgi:hypothetical protein
MPVATSRLFWRSFLALANCVDLDGAQFEVRFQRDVNAAAEAHGEGVGVIAATGLSTAAVRRADQDLREGLRAMRAFDPRLRKTIASAAKQREDRQGTLRRTAGAKLGAELSDHGPAGVHVP